jgi:hypothetical protein
MIEDQVVRADPNVTAALALGRYEEDPSKSLGVIDAVGSPGVALSAALGLFDRLGRNAPPEFRRALLERATSRGREIEPPGQAAIELARVADLWFHLDDAGRGTALVRETPGLAAKPGQSPFRDPVDEIAPVLALGDLPAALKLLEGREPARRREEDGTLSRIAFRIAATDPAGARRVIAMIKGPGQEAARRFLELRTAKDANVVKALADAERDPKATARLLTSEASARAGTDPGTARALLRESVARLVRLDDESEDPWGRPAVDVALARLLPLATRVDPDRASDYLWLAMSRRPPAPREPSPATSRVLRPCLELAVLAALVAPYDRPAAEVVISPVLGRLAGLVDDRSGLGQEGPALFQAAGLYDARAARKLLDTLPDDPGPPPNGRPLRSDTVQHRSKALARIALARTLALPPALRTHEAPLPYRNLWPEGIGD